MLLGVAYKYCCICFLLPPLTDKFLFACLFLLNQRELLIMDNGLCFQGCCNLIFFFPWKLVQTPGYSTLKTKQVRQISFKKCVFRCFSLFCFYSWRIPWSAWKTVTFLLRDHLLPQTVARRFPMTQPIPAVVKTPQTRTANLPHSPKEHLTPHG